MKVFFIVQGEGRGHITQAISLSNILKRNGVDIVGVCIGKGTNEDLKCFLQDELNAEIKYFNSPTLSYRNDGQGLSLKNTFLDNLKNSKKYISSLKEIKAFVLNTQPDIIINFYDLMGGILKLSNPFLKIPMICIGHQYLMQHSSFKFPEASWTDKLLVEINTRITAMGASKKLALSLKCIPKEGKIIGIAPLLKSEIFKIKSTSKNYYLAYLTNPCMLDSLIKWQKENTSFEIHCFCKLLSDVDQKEIQSNFFIHKINQNKFIEYMAGCKAFISTAGFESICEAMVLKKPVFCVPVINHFEQSCNAHDFYNYGAAMKDKSFNLDGFASFIETYESNLEELIEWCNSNNTEIIRHLKSTIKKKKINKYLIKSIETQKTWPNYKLIPN